MHTDATQRHAGASSASRAGRTPAWTSCQVPRRGSARPPTAGHDHGVGAPQAVADAEPKSVGGNDLAGAVRADQSHFQPTPALIWPAVRRTQDLVRCDGVQLIEPTEHSDLDSHA